MIRRHYSRSRFLSSIVAVALLSLAATGCVPLLFNDCGGRESRLETTIADLIDQSGTLVGSAHLTMSERRGDENQRNVQLVLAGPPSAAPGGPLRGHITAVVLAEAADAFRFDIPILPPTPYGTEIFAPAGIHVGAPEYSLLRQAALDGRLRLYVETGPEVPVVRDVSFPAARAGEWQCPVYT